MQHKVRRLFDIYEVNIFCSLTVRIMCYVKVWKYIIAICSLVLRRGFLVRCAILALKLFEELFSNTFNAVRKLSEQWNVRAGVRQGGVVWDFLFSLCIDNLLGISKQPYSCLLGINIQAYADNIVVYCPSAIVLRLLLQKLEILLCEHNLLLNTSETKIAIFGGKYCAANSINS